MNLQISTRRLLGAIERLGTIKAGKTLFEHSPTKDAECHAAWLELSDAIKAAHTSLEPALTVPAPATHGAAELRGKIMREVHPFTDMSKGAAYSLADRILALLPPPSSPGVSQDSARLDWLEKQREDFVQRDQHGDPELLSYSWEVVAQAHDVRTAIDIHIDAAMRQPGTSATEPSAKGHANEL